MAKKWTKAYVTTGTLGVFSAEVATSARSNRTVLPRFHSRTAQQIVEVVGRRNSQSDLPDAERLSWDGDVIVSMVPTHAGRPGYQPTRLPPDQDGMYVIETQTLVWSEVWCQGQAHEGEPDDLVIPVATIEPDAETETVLAYCVPCLAEAGADPAHAVITLLPPL